MKKKYGLKPYEPGYKRHIHDLRRQDKVYSKQNVSQKIGKERKKITKLCRSISKGARDKYFNTFGFNDELLVDKLIYAPSNCDLIKNYDEVLRFTKAIYSSFQSELAEVTISFKFTKNITLPTLLLIRALTECLKKEFRKISSGKAGGMVIETVVKVEPAEFATVNQLLNAADFISLTRDKADKVFIPVMKLPFRHGTFDRKEHTKNAKGKYSKYAIGFVNKAMERKNWRLTRKSLGALSRMLGEMLSNGEDHSIGREWFVMGTLHQDGSANTEVIDILDLCILNFGDSISKGLMANAHLNKEQNDALEGVYEKFLEMNPPAKTAKFNKSNLFTLFALQQGISRLKHKDESRGTGTIDFIDGFMQIGSYVDAVKGHFPEMVILSGDTIVKCDNRFQPHKLEDGTKVLALNEERDLRKLPSEKHLINLRNSFPGTMLSIKIYLSSTHFDKVFNNEGRRD